MYINLLLNNEIENILLTKIQTIKQYIEKLYSPNPSHDVNQIQQHLQVIQKSADGLPIAHELLSNPAYSTNAKYFGALTLTVQLNTNVDSLDKLWALFKENLIHLTKLSNIYVSNPQINSAYFTTIKKLMSNLSLIYTNINEHESSPSSESDITYWHNPLNTMVLLLLKANELSIDQWQKFEDPQIDQVVRSFVNAPVTYQELIGFINISPLYNKILLTFTEIIVEDLTKFQTRKTTMTNIYKVLHDHLYISTMSLINANLSMQVISEEVLYACINSWINCISVFRNISPHGNMDLTEMFENLIQVMYRSNDQTDNFSQAENILGIFTNVFANDPTLMNYELRSQIEAVFLGVSKSGNADISKNTWMLQYMNHLVTNQMTNELKELAICIVDFLQINTLDVCNKLFKVASSSHMETENIQQYIKVLLQLTNFPLTPILEEFFSVRMVDFWLDLSDCYSNLSLEILSPQGPEIATNIFQQVVSVYLPKISLMNKQNIIAEEGEDSSLHEFEDFRSAASDLIESLWSVLGNDKLTNVLIEGISNTSVEDNTNQNIDIFQTEAMSYLLNTLLVDMTLSESPWICDIIGSNKSFIPNVLILLESGLQSPADTVPSRYLKLDFIRTSSTLLCTLSGYFLQDSSQLSSCVEVLFQGLEKCSSTGNVATKELNDKLETLLIKSIHGIFETCREELSSYLDHFLDILGNILRPDSNVSNFTREQLMHAIGYIIQSKIENGPQEQATYINQMVDIIDNLIGISNSGSIQAQCNYVHSLLNCISELGSALSQPEETENPILLQKLPEFQEYWCQDPLDIRRKVLSLLDKVISNSQYGKDSRFIEVSCLILGKALTLPNDEPHFLKYNMSEIMDFVLKQVPSSELSKSLPYFVYLLERMIMQFKGNMSSQDVEFIFERFFLAYYQQSIENDPDLLQTVINFVNTILDTKPGLIIYTKYWTSFILPEFLKILPAREKFTISATTKFWTKVINNKKYTEQELETTKAQIISIGHDLVYQTMYGLYHTQRSDLNSYTDLVRTLMAKFPLEMKQWLIVALPKICDNNSVHEKFINKLSVTRGSRAAGSVLLEWWLKCNALPTF